MSKIDEIIIKHGTYQQIKDLLDYHNQWSDFISIALPILRDKIKQLNKWSMFLDIASKIEAEDIFRAEAELEAFVIVMDYIATHQPIISEENKVALYGRSIEEIEEANSEAEWRWLESEFNRLGIGWENASRIVDEEYNELQKRNK